jgi:hypothetical protein
LDPATGLRTEFFYAPLAELDRQGAPISQSARQYLRENPQPGSGYGSFARSRADDGYNARAQIPSRGEPVIELRPWGGGSGGCNWNQSEHNGAGAPEGPYCFGN